jgi:hypothetical protein
MFIDQGLRLSLSYHHALNKPEYQEMWVILIFLAQCFPKGELTTFVFPQMLVCNA